MTDKIRKMLFRLLIRLNDIQISLNNIFDTGDLPDTLKTLALKYK